ncbi:O-acetyl-ADP-ribose deacetylase [Dyella caseinilytica]|uniref:O-acetyl-ADP-ribose deacetylase n=1 Tax=Dyella caseinilytica TaxID=1849581 RepID=A0ABX7GR01_9GAMM|nr:O-acetyl-ADP-ribose deacetylase [Dyella caseinilytica]QRN52856.1 O-acetyl-ADP-ribose deacetylase [Dyella caseinilytica]GGA09290.1 macro domain-containing protein [Dyella caseinilytica]
MSITVVTADLTRLTLDAIVNAANPGLLGGGGVDGAIHRAAGPALLVACRNLPEVSPGVRCPTGEARLTPGFALPARFVIHTVGPVWHGGQDGEAELLARCYHSCITLALEHDLHSIGFPAISCGVYGYPPEQAANVAIAALRIRLAAHPMLDVQLCCFGDRMAATWQNALSA